MIDPLDTLQVDVQSYDVKRIASVYSDNVGEKWWTKAWFNGREKGEPAKEISRSLAISFIRDMITKDDWLSRFYPQQMESYYKAIDQTRRQLLGL